MFVHISFYTDHVQSSLMPGAFRWYGLCFFVICLLASQGQAGSPTTASAVYTSQFCAESIRYLVDNTLSSSVLLAWLRPSDDPLYSGIHAGAWPAKRLFHVGGILGRVTWHVVKSVDTFSSGENIFFTSQGKYKSKLRPLTLNILIFFPP